MMASDIVSAPRPKPRIQFSVRLLLTLAVLCHASCREDRPTSRPASVGNEVTPVAQSGPTSAQTSPQTEELIIGDSLDWPTSRDWPASREASPYSMTTLFKEIRSAVAQYLTDHP